MRNIILSLLAALSIGFSSCEKVIDISLDDAEKKYVIEGVLSDQPGSCRVLISQTKNFNDDNSFEGMSGGVVTITDNTGNVTPLAETSAGVYASDTLAGVSGKTYALEININGKTFTASSAMPHQITMDSLYITEDSFFGETRKLANVQYQDPPGLGNSYRLVQYINGVKEKGIYIRNDDYSDGNVSVITMWFSPDEDKDKIKSGDTIKVDMLCIDPFVFKYWYSLDNGATGDSNSASPANPVSNIVGNALGYFSAHTSETKTIVVP